MPAYPNLAMDPFAQPKLYGFPTLMHRLIEALPERYYNSMFQNFNQRSKNARTDLLADHWYEIFLWLRAINYYNICGCLYKSRTKN